MHAWLKRAVAGLLSAVTLLGGGLLTAGTANADEIRMPDIGKTITSLTASAATTYPRELVNGGFDYLPAGGWNVISPKLNTSRGKFTSVDPVNGQYIRNAHVTDGNVAWVKWDGFDASKFGWISDQKGGKPQGFVTDHANSVELQRDNDTDNTYAEIVGSEIGKSIYQKIDTQNSTDAVYTVRFDHAALSSEHADGMQALVNGKPVTMTRIGGNKAGDKTGWTGTDIVTHATNTDHYRHDGQWATYEGKVTIPANTPVSTFMFKSLNEAKPDMGNLIDNLTFKIAYRLSYDSNGGTKAKASQISSMTEGKASETDGKVKTVADDAATVANTTNTLPDHLVNGDFEYPVKSDMPVNDGNFWYISQNDGSYFAKGTVLGKRYKLPEGFDKAKFAWHSTQTGDTSYPDLERADDVQVDYKADGTNHYSEISAAQSGATLYQDVATVPGVMYKWSLKHASLDSSHLDKMSVIIGEPGKETAQEATRTTANGHGDKLGKVGTVISTKVSNPKIPDSNKSQEGAHTGQWETYTGTYIATGTVTRFAFHSIEGYSAWDGNLLDDISFSKAYKLTYDKNASDATGKVPSNQRGKENAVEPAESKTTGNVKTVADNTSNLPDHLVNGTFDYRGNEIINENQRVYGSHDTTYLAIISAKTGVIGNPLHSKLDNWDSGKFGWKSNDATAGVDTVEVQRRNHTPYPTNAGNVWGEIAAAKRGKYIYQDIATTPGVVYEWSLKHASRNADQDDSMQVMIGEPGAEAVQEATRTTSNGTDKVGEKSTTITTHGTAQDGRWETYTGDYLATSTTTRFTFRSVRDSNGQGLDFTAEGNCVDDLSFDKAYKLSYDKNSSDATGSVPSNQYGKENTVQPAKSKTTGTVKTVADENVRYGSLANGDFSYPSFSDIQENEQETDADLRTFLKSDDGTLWDNMSATDLSKYGKIGQIPGFDSSRFAWSSTENGSRVELQQDRNTKNTYAEIVAQQDNTSLYQNVSTGNGGVLYKIRLKHASRQSSHADRMQVLVGSDTAHATPVEMTRVTSNGHGDKVGGKSTTITTKVSNTDPRDHGSQWETYEGYYQVPEGQKNTVFMFKSLEGFKEYETLPGNNVGNLVDDIEFSRSYKLTYDKNSSDAAGQVPSNQRGKENTVQPAKAKTAGSVGLAAGKTASGLTVHDLKKNDKGKVPSSSKADSTQPAAFKAPDAKVETIASRSAGDELAVNGGFDTPKWTIAKEGQGLPWVYVKPNAGMIRSYAQAMGGQPGVKAGGLTAATFAWQDLDAIGGNQNFELHREKDGNTAADVHAGRTVAQTVNTTPGASYTFSIRHSGRSKGNAGGVTLLTGPDKDHLTPVKLTRTTVSKTGQKYGDKTGDVGTVAYTHSDSMDATEGSHEPWDHSDDWESYEGTVIIPAGQSRTMIAYRGVAKDGTLTASANDSIIDDLSFRLAYKLSYDANGGTGQVPSRTETGRTETAASGTDGTVRLAADKSAGPESGTIADDRRVLTDTTARQDDGTSQRTITRSDGSVRVETIADTGAVSGCQVYYPAGTRITLATAKADSDCWDSSQIGKTNRTFYGWSANTDANDRDVPVGDTMDRNTLNANVRTEIVMPARAKTVYALWAINPTLSYNVNAPAGSNAPGTPASQTVPYNTAAADKSGWAAGDTGKIPGYRFDGWYTAPNGGNKYDFNTPLTNNVTVYAHWVGNGYTVRFAGNGATGGNTPDQAFQYNIGQNLHRNGFVRDGYTFTGWKRADNQQAYGDGQWVTNLTTQPNGIVTMVAQWSANEAHIRYNPNPPAGKTTGGNGTPNWDGHTGDTPTIGQNGWTIDGYTFAGWTTSPDGSGTKYAPGARWTANGTLTLYAQWTPGQASLTYDGNGATGGKTDPQNGVTDQKVNVRQNGFTRDGYTFVTWNTQADCRGKAVNPGDKWTLQGSSTLYACWAGTAQTLTYHGNGATGGNTAAQSGHTGDELTTNANGFTRDGYTFVRWDTAKDGSGTAYGEGRNGVGRYTMKPAGNDLYAIWQANPASIQYRDDWGATGSTPDTTGVTGQNVTIAQNGFTRPGYTFTGWARDRRTDPSLQPGGRYTLTPGTTTLWAQWKADPAHLIYNSNSGSTSQTRRTDGVVDQTLTVIANPFTRTGYTFTGWNTQADGRGKAYTAGNGFRLVADPKSNPVNTSVLYAQWRINRVTLKFDPNGGTGRYPDITVDAFTTVTIPADAKEPKVQRPGFRFTGWAMKPTPGAGDTILSPGKGTVSMPDRGSITVYAQWAPAMTTLPFTGGQAQVPTIWLYAGFALMLIALGVMMPMLRMRMAATKRTGKHMPITGGKHAK